ncbi:hypothetical protein QVA66_10820 [Staphylococcus chromogenes]|nr:hypothetical protein [Staphylococcus chromogenes]
MGDAKQYASLEDLSRWFSSARLESYSEAGSPEALYLWNTRLSKTFLQDIQHVEVALRNVIDKALTCAYSAEWFDYRAVPTPSPIPFSEPSKKSIRTAIRRARWESGLPTGKVIAELTFDFWYFLLSRSYQTTVWPKLLPLLNGRPARDEFQAQVKVCYDMRNRAAHHEPLIKRHRNDENKLLDGACLAVQCVTTWISLDCAEWVQRNSEIPAVRAQRP